jgi:Caspase domain
MRLTALVNIISSAVLLTALVFPSAAQAPNDIRIALIIGNSAYPGNMALANPSNDAKDMAATLRNMGFGVIEVLDGNRAQMMEAIERAGKSLSGKQGVGMLFYAGHGLQLDWRNYMVPVDAKLSIAADVPKHTIDIEAVMTAFKSAGNRMNIVVLDACRDDPFANGKTSTGKGLAPLDAPTGTFLAYATAPGNVAQDGTGKNGLYTSFLLQELQKPTARIEDVFKRVRFAVRKASNGAQIPWETTSLEDDFVFNSGIKKAVKLSDNEKDKQFEIEKAEWDKIKDSKSADPIYVFVQRYPTGLLASAAQGAIDRLNATKVLAYKTKAGEQIELTSTERFKVGNSMQIERQDGYTKQISLKRTIRPTRIENGMVYFDDSTILTTDGALVSSAEYGGDVFDPPLQSLPSEHLTVNRKWVARSNRISNGTKIGWQEVDGKITAYEKVTTRAGTFDAYKIEIIQWGRGGNKRIITQWIAPSVSYYPIKTIFEMSTPNNRVGTDRWIEEAVSITRGS